jgi:hypothetical protein
MIATGFIWIGADSEDRVNEVINLPNAFKSEHLLN